MHIDTISCPLSRAHTSIWWFSIAHVLLMCVDGNVPLGVSGFGPDTGYDVCLHPYQVVLLCCLDLDQISDYIVL